MPSSPTSTRSWHFLHWSPAELPPVEGPSENTAALRLRRWRLHFGLWRRRRHRNVAALDRIDQFAPGGLADRRANVVARGPLRGWLGLRPSRRRHKDRAQEKEKFLHYCRLEIAPRSLNRIEEAKSTCRIFGQATANRKRWKIILIDATDYLGIWPRLTRRGARNRRRTSGATDGAGDVGIDIVGMG